MFPPEIIVPYEGIRGAANDGEVTAVHGADEVRTVLVDEPETRDSGVMCTTIYKGAVRGHYKR